MHHEILEELARKAVGMPDEWAVFYWEALDSGVYPNNKLLGYKLRGAIAPPKKSGPSKGQPNWQARDRSTDREVTVSAADYEAYEAEWVARTGNCPKCAGKAKRCVGGSAESGPRWAPCPACEGTGKAKSLASV